MSRRGGRDDIRQRRRRRPLRSRLLMMWLAGRWDQRMTNRGGRGGNRGHNRRSGGELGRRAAEQGLPPRQKGADTPVPAARAVELARERAPRPEEQRLHRAFGQRELLGNLLVREPLPLAEQDRALLVRRELGERVGTAGQLVVRPTRRRRQPGHAVRVPPELGPVSAPRGTLA